MMGYPGPYSCKSSREGRTVILKCGVKAAGLDPTCGLGGLGVLQRRTVIMNKVGRGQEYTSMMLADRSRADLLTGSQGVDDGIACVPM